jgi:energy-coupling factor transport system ATP-binding protein
LLVARELFFAYSRGQTPVLRGLEWTLRRGDFAALFGANGSGKSTLLQLMAGLREPQRGRVELEGAPLCRLPVRERTARVGYLAQNPLLHFAHETLREDLVHAAAFAGAANPAEEAERLARRFGLTALLERHPHDLSGGERQLAALAIAVSGEPAVLLLDEPTKGLDPFAKARLADELRRMHRAGMTLLMATHDVEFAAAHASRCALLFGGDIVADEPADTFFRDNFFYASPLHRLARETDACRPFQPAAPPREPKETPRTEHPPERRAPVRDGDRERYG